MRCLYCGKKLGLLKRAHGEEFCSPQHHDAYAQQAENALNRLRDSPEKVKEPEPAAVAEPPAVVAAAPSAIAPSVIAARKPAPAPEPPSLPPPPPPQAPLLQQAYPAQIPPESAKLIPGGPEEVRLTPPTPPKLNLVVAAEIPAPPPIPPMGSSVLTLKAISVSAKSTEAEPFDFLIEMARPRLAVPPVRESVLAPVVVEPEVVPEPEVKASSTEQKPIFEGDFESPWTLTAAAPEASDLAVPPQLTPIRMRLMDGTQPEHHPLPVNITALTVDTCFSDAPASKIGAGVLPHGRPTELLRKPGPPVVRHAVEVQISPEAEGFFAAAQSVQSSTKASGFAILKNPALDLPRVFSGRTVPVVSRPGDFIPIENNAAGAGLFEKEAGAQVVGPRSIAVLPNEPSACGFAPVGFEDLCPAIEVQRQGVQTELQALGAVSAVDGGSSLKEIRLPRKMSCYRTAGLQLRDLEVPPADPLDIERPAADLSADPVDLQVSPVGSQPIGFDRLSTITWKQRITPDPIVVSIAPGVFGQTEFAASALPPPAGYRLSGPALPEQRFLPVSTMEELKRSSVNLLSLRPVTVPEISIPGIPSLPRIPRRFGVVTFQLRKLESIDCAELIQSSGAADGFSGCPALDPDESRALPESGAVAHTTALRNDAPSLEWNSNPADLPKYQPFVKFLPARRALEFTRPV